MTDVRDDEMSALIKAAYMNSFTTFLWTSAPFLVALASFATFVLIDPVNNILDASTGLVTNTDFILFPFYWVLYSKDSLRGCWCLSLITSIVQMETDCEKTCKLTAFVSLTLFNLLRIPLNMLPMLIVYMVQVNRLSKEPKERKSEVYYIILGLLTSVQGVCGPYQHLHER